MKKFLIATLGLFLLSCQTSENHDWTDLFNGDDLDGWHTYLAGDNYNGWYVQDGVLAFDPESRTEARSSNLMTDRKYSDFELSIEWMISENGNSGIFWGVLEDEDYEHPYLTGPEIQILDDGWEEYIQERGDINRAGSLYNLMAPSKIVSKGAVEWNHYLLHIDQTNNEGWLKFNDEEILQFPVNGPEWEAMIAESPLAAWEGFGKAKTGHICLQEHGSEVAFRNIKIREL